MTRPLNSKAPMVVVEAMELELVGDLEAALVTGSLISSAALLSPALNPLRRSPAQAAVAAVEEEAVAAAAVEEVVEVEVAAEEVVVAEEAEDLVADQSADLWASSPALLSSARRTSRPCASPVSRTRELAATWARCQRAALATSTARLVPTAREAVEVEDKEEDFAALNNKALALAVEATHWPQTRTQLRTPTRSDGQAAATSSTRATRASSTPRASVVGARRRRVASSRSSKLFPLSSFLSMDGWYHVLVRLMDVAPVSMASLLSHLAVVDSSVDVTAAGFASFF